ncbi:MAG: ubiquinol-cytochrome c reductase iron-sulfur subunit [Burkholderiales bacterium]|nr:ubiquinol-cytochrome c reductase iron-sulfur subunit [Burkholderiales bacterium]MDE1928970.1 ubiquinol-cytochrome c reductase iron-sulfur subunit [Burkholderiales bacterium]MDE2158322.1 ubiquinol-cytochrome c reductase iron-sulfur subunit [Burkholderiales bacterium]MDE2501419.1 ubiquinol-cytochrome c reductase iron-sulfur subunit [Burkholderiales bacterium]
MTTSAPSVRPRAGALDERRLLLRATGFVGGAGLVAAAIPFVETFEPSARDLARSGPVDAELGDLRPGQMRTVAWRGKPVWLLRRTPAMVAALERPDPLLLDPLSHDSVQPPGCVNPTRSLKPEYLVALGVCTHLGCTPILHLHDAQLDAQLDAPGGYICPCHGSRFDLAGRVIRNVPAPRNLEIPPHRYTSATALRIG